MKPTLKDIALEAGVSAMAVSAVLHGTGKNVKVSDEKAELIRRVANDLRYHPNHLARSLRSRRTHTIGVVFQHFDRLSEENPYYPMLLNGVMSALFPADYTLALCPKLAQGSAIGALSDGRFDGILWCRPDFTEASVDLLRRASTPVVMMHAPSGSVPGVATFCADNDSAMRTAIDYLVTLGHSRIGFVIDPINQHTAEGRARAEAFLSAAVAREVTAEVVVWDFEAAGVRAYKGLDRPHTALVVFSDTLAGHVLAACDRYGVCVPQDLSVVGFDSSSFCERTKPRLTSVHQPVELMAREATGCLLALIRSGRDGAPSACLESVVYACDLDVRDSTARAAV
jgi:LacI family transcriptional regulator